MVFHWHFYQPYFIIIKSVGVVSCDNILAFYLGVSPSGKANGSDPFIVGSNPTTPANTNLI